MGSATENHQSVPIVRQNAWLKVLATAIDFYIILLAALLLTGKFQSVSNFGDGRQLYGSSCLCSFLL